MKGSFKRGQTRVGLRFIEIKLKGAPQHRSQAIPRVAPHFAGALAPNPKPKAKAKSNLIIIFDFCYKFSKQKHKNLNIVYIVSLPAIQIRFCTPIT